MSVPRATPKLAKARKVKPMAFETALRHLRAGKVVRRRAWNAQSRIFKLGSNVFLKLPDSVFSDNRPAINSGYGSSPTFWKPYPSDFLATDWEVVR